MTKYFRLTLGVCSLTLVFVFIPRTAFSQEKLGAVSYSPLPGWTKTQTQPNVVAFSIVNKATGAFCIITLYDAKPSTGNPQSDFAREWKNLVVQNMKTEVNPKTETDLVDGWTATVGAEPVEFANDKAIAILTVLSGFGKSVSVLGVLKDQACITQLTAFASGLKIDKAAAAAPSVQPNRTTTQTSQPGQPGQFGSMTYASPAGWSQQQFPDGVIFKPLDLPAGEVLAMQIMPSLNASGTLEQALAHSYDEAATMYKGTKMFFAGGGGNYQATDPQKSFNGWEYIRGRGGIKIENATPYATELGLELFVIKVNNRFERVAILESRPNCQLSRYYSSDRRAYRNGIESLLFSLKFSDLSEPALTSGSTTGTGIVGVWQGISLSTSGPSVGEPLGVRYKVFSPIFLSNGQAYFGPKFPTEGLNGLNTRIPPELYRRDWGTYSFSNGRGVLKMRYAEIPLRMQGDKLIINVNQTDHAFYRLPSVDGATFNGTYTLSELNGRIPSITFSSDGRFADNGALKVLYHEYVDCINAAPTAGSGTYEVKDYSVVFTYTDGRKIQLAFLGAEYTKGNPSPATLLMSFNEDRLVRQ